MKNDKYLSLKSGTHRLKWNKVVTKFNWRKLKIETKIVQVTIGFVWKFDEFCKVYDKNGTICCNFSPNYMGYCETDKNELDGFMFDSMNQYFGPMKLLDFLLWKADEIEHLGDYPLESIQFNGRQS